MTSENQIQHTASMAAKWWGDRLERGDREKFEAALREAVVKELREQAYCYLQCDYDPLDLLLEAVHAAGIECCGYCCSAKGILPMKHSTVIWLTEIEPKEGYGNRTATISTQL